MIVYFDLQVFVDRFVLGFGKQRFIMGKFQCLNRCFFSTLSIWHSDIEQVSAKPVSFYNPCVQHDFGQNLMGIWQEGTLPCF